MIDVVETDIIETKKGAALGIKINLQRVPLFIIRAEKGYLCCGYFNAHTIEKTKDCAVIIKGVKSFNDMLNKRVSYISTSAKKLGIRSGMRGEAALERMM